MDDFEASGVAIGASTPWEKEAPPAGDKNDVTVTRERKKREKIVRTTKFLDDPWKPLDPHASDGTGVCEFRRMKNYRVPSVLVETETKGSKKKGKLTDNTPTQSFDQFINQAFRKFDFIHHHHK